MQAVVGSFIQLYSMYRKRVWTEKCISICLGVAMPTCGLAMAEAERYLPDLVTKIESICEENGLRNDSIVMRMTGCPNGCARPWVAEVAFVGKAPGTRIVPYVSCHSLELTNIL